MPDKSVIKKWAAAAAATAAVLPAGADAAALFGEEVLMVINVASLFGKKISREVATQALTTGALGTIAGSLIFEGFNIGYPLTIPAKIAVATGVMVSLGNATYEIFENGGTL